ncbi:MAG: hypothetical protein JJU18_09745 [Oceanicaulis sp.]|nr:hypothetical protein [Oceanicaulis sp.]
MDKILLQRVEAALELTNSLGEGLAADDLGRRIDQVPSNSIGSQFWCVVGARESYRRGMLAGEWQGFSCSLAREQTRQPASMQAALAQTRDDILKTAAAMEWGGQAAQLLFDLWEHEVMHQGQLVRYFYANAIAFPAAFASRYALAQPAPVDPGA